jgi:phosphoglycolate phosphatase-like HAD superfamily hydrolase
MIKLLLFDLDGTLFLNEQPFWRMENGIAIEMGFLPVSRGKHKSFWYIPAEERAAKLWPQIDIRDFKARQAEKIAGCVRNRKIDAIKPGNIAILEILKKRGKRLVVLSSRQSGEIEHLLEGENRLGRWFEKIYFSGNLFHNKPDARAFSQAMSDFCVMSGEAIYIADLPADGVCAKKAGLGFIACLQEGIMAEDDFRSVGVDFFAGTLPNILEYIK